MIESQMVFCQLKEEATDRPNDRPTERPTAGRKTGGKGATEGRKLPWPRSSSLPPFGGVG